MRVAVVGLSHLGSVTAVCMAAAGHDVWAWDSDAAVVSALRGGAPPVNEPGLGELARKALDAGRLHATTDLQDAVGRGEVVWVAFDTPVDAEDRADTASVIRRVESTFPYVQDRAVVFVSSQLPVGSVRGLEQAWAQVAAGRDVGFACSPENLRLGRAIDVFMNPDRVVVGTRREADREKIRALFEPITERLEWMSIESAEMTKHAINAFLAMSVSFINEIATLAEAVGADAKEVERGLKTEARIGPHAYLSPGGAFAGGTLARDVAFLLELGRKATLPTALFDGVLASNELHRAWTRTRLTAELGALAGKRIAIWGLTYKPGTDTLRRSAALELCRWLLAEGARVTVHDPAAEPMPAELRAVERTDDPGAALRGADALVVATEWPLYLQFDATRIASEMARPLIIDANRFLGSALAGDSRIRLVSVGQPAAVGREQRERRREGGSADRPREPEPPSGYSLEGRGAIITGASQGLGLEIARAYVRAGASVVLCARNPAKLSEAARSVAALARPGQTVSATPADVSNEADVRKLVDSAVERLGRVHILVNNAGVYGPMGTIDQVDWSSWLRALEINVFGSVLLCRMLVPHFRRHRYGKIVQLSGGGATSPLPRITAYAASKAAIVRFAESLAGDVRDDGIDVNAIAPGALNTGMMQELLAAGPGVVGEDFYARMQKIADEGGTPLATGAELAVFLGSAASDGISGRLLSAVWDRWRELPSRRSELEKNDVYTLRRIVPKDRGLDW